jgi:non-specific serine/threonine protein kinase
MTESLASRHLLLVLDNTEHVLGACAQLVDAMLRGCAQLIILVTSRERLGIAGELTYRVPSLSVPDPTQDATPEHTSAYESARLFIERARLQRPHFAVTAENAPALASICHRLDGIPLAIELAAPRVRSMSVEEVSQRLDRRFGLLTGGSRTALPRHRTLRALIDWSYDLLSDAEKAMLRRVSVFAGGWTLEAAEQVCIGDDVDAREVLDLLTSLADKNLVSAEAYEGATRYGLLETVRHYALDRLWESGEEMRAQARHLAYYLALSVQAAPKLSGADQLIWLDRLEKEHDNLRAALAWSSAAGGDAAGGLRLASALFGFWHTRSHFGEGRRWLSGLLAAAPNEQDAAVRAKALRAAGVLSGLLGDYPAARELHEEGLAIGRKLGDRLAISRSLNNLGSVVLNQGDYPSARALYEESLAIYRELGNRQGIAMMLNNLGTIAHREGDYPAARALHEECLGIARKLSDRRDVALSLLNLGDTVREQGDYPAARALFEESLAIQGELGDQHNVARALEGFAAVVFALVGPARAARIWGQAAQLREEIGAPLEPPDRSRYNHHVAAARAAMCDDAAFDRAWQEGRDMTLEQAVQYALDADDAAPP